MASSAKGEGRKLGMEGESEESPARPHTGGAPAFLPAFHNGAQDIGGASQVMARWAVGPVRRPVDLAGGRAGGQAGQVIISLLI